MSRRILRVLLPVCLLALLAMAGQAQAVPDYYIKVSGIPGESAAHGFEDQIVVSNYTWKIERWNRTGRNTQLPKLDDFVFTHKVDRSSPLLFGAAATGNHIRSALFSVVKPGTAPATPVEYCMEDIVVKSVEATGDETNIVPTEKVDFNPGKFEERYNFQTSTGTISPVFFGWDIFHGGSIGFADNCGADPVT